MITPFTFDGHDYEIMSVSKDIWIVIELPSMRTVTSIHTDPAQEYYCSDDHRAHVNSTTLLDFAKSIIASEY